MRAEDFVGYLEGVTVGGNGWNARCPAHGDSNASLSVSVGDDQRVLVNCHAGCTPEEVVHALGFELRHLFAGVEPEPTVEELAAHKALDAQQLRSYGLTDLDNSDGVGISYKETDGREVHVKRRTALVAKDGSRWPVGQPLLAYGLWFLAWFAQLRWLILVEGESDCWTGWAHSFPTLGIPGATCVRATLRADILQAVECIIVIQEPDNGGRVFVEGVRRVLSEAEWSGTAQVVQLPGAKDLNEFYQQHRATFVQDLNAVLAQAQPLEAEPTVASADGEWPEPGQLSGSGETVPPFDPVALLPESLRVAVTDISDLTGAPVEYPAVGMLTGLAAVVGRRIAIRPRQLTDWQVIPNLWALVVGPPGVLKTPAMRAALDPVYKLDEAVRASQASTAADRDFEQLVAKERREEISRRIREALKNGNDPSLLRAQMAAIGGATMPLKQLIVSDITAEKLVEILAANPNGILLYRDELTGLLALLLREGREGERQFYLEAWSGDQSFTMGRIGRGISHVPAACVSVAGTIQPGPLARHIRAAIGGGDNADGLIQRFQLLVQPDHQVRHAIDRAPNAAARGLAAEVHRRLYEHPPAAFLAQPSDGQPPYLRFAVDAQPVFDEWYAGLEAKLASTSAPAHLVAHLSKYRKLMPAVALLLHLADVAAGVVPPGPVSRAAAEMAVRWCILLEQHAQRIYGAAVTSTRPAHRLAQKITSGELGTSFTAREVYRRHWSGLDSMEVVEEALVELEGANWVRRVQEGQGGQRTIRNLINPKVMAQ